MKSKILMLSTLLLIAMGTALGQTINVKGVVYDENGDPMFGVTVRAKNDASNGAQTNFDGEFALQKAVKQGEIIIFSSVGYKTQELPAAANMTVKMVTDAEMLDEVIVVAYGTTTKAAFTGSASKVDSKSLRESGAISPINALQGKAAGVVISESSGQPGAAPTIRVRGIGSITGNRSPLYVIDGVPVNTAVTSEQNSGSLLNLINPEDIDTQTILKDAAATALYGSRGANGVVVITTKSGKSGDVKINFTTEYGQSSFAQPHMLDYMDANEYANYAFTALKNLYIYNNEGFPEQANAANYKNLLAGAEQFAYRNLIPGTGLFHPLDKFDGSFDYDNMTPEQQKMMLTGMRTTDWRNILFQNGTVQKYDISASGGSEKLSFYSSLGYQRNTGITENTYFERFSGNLSLKANITDNVRVSISEMLSKSEQKGNLTHDGWYYANPMFAYYNLNPSSPHFIKDKTTGEEVINNHAGFNAKTPNPILNNRLNPRTSGFVRSLTNATLQVKFTDWLNFKSTNGVDFVFTDNKTITHPESNDGIAKKGLVYRNYVSEWTLTTSNLLSFDKMFDQHRVNAFVGYEFKDYTFAYISGEASGFATPKLLYLSNGAVREGVGEGFSKDKLMSYLFKVDYDYANKYYLSASWRKDGSSRLSKTARWGDFYSTSLAWVISNEDFMSDVKWLNLLKLKASYGTTGNLPTGFYAAHGLYSVSGKYLGKPTYELSQLENTDLSWETSRTFNIGFDFSILDNRLGGSFEYYRKKTDGLLNKTPLMYTTGFSSFQENRGDLLNYGVEVELNSVNIDRGDFRWTTDLNITHFNTIITKLDEPIDQFPFFYGEGDQMFTYFLREWAGVNPDNGLPQWYTNTEVKDPKTGKVTRSREITSDPTKAEKIKIGSAIPVVAGGITNRFEYKGFDLSFLLTYKIGGLVYDGMSYNHTDGRAIGSFNIRKSTLGKHWEKPGDHAEYSRLIYGAPDQGWNNSDRRLMDGSYLKLKNLTLGYSLPKKWSKSLSVNNVRLYMNATDLFTIFKENYIDPEVGINGMALDATLEIPRMRSFRFGVNISL